MYLQFYTRKDWIIISVLLPPVVVAVNYTIFGGRYFSEAGVFFLSTAITAVAAFVSWLLQIVVAIHLQRKYPRYGDTIKRLAIALSLYILLTSFTISIVFWAYDYVGFFNYHMNWRHFCWAIITGIVVCVLA